MSVRGYNDITPRVAIVYDIFGQGRTALKVNFGKYLEAATADSIYSSNNPAARIITRVGSGPGSAARGWTDGNKNYIVDCDLLNPAAQDRLATGGDLCAALGGLNLNFGNANPNTTTINPDILGGWGVRPYDWQINASVQHELVPRVSIEAGYYRRWWGNFFGPQLLTTAADYDTYSITIPQHDNLPGAGDTAQFVAITPAAAARGAQNLQTRETDYGDARTAYWHGVDFTATARLANGFTLQGGTSTGRAIRKLWSPRTSGAPVPPCRFVRRDRKLTRTQVPRRIPSQDRVLSHQHPVAAAFRAAGRPSGTSLTATYVCEHHPPNRSDAFPQRARDGNHQSTCSIPGRSSTLTASTSSTCASRRSCASRGADDLGLLDNLFNSRTTTGISSRTAANERRGVPDADRDRSAAPGAVSRDVNF